MNVISALIKGTVKSSLTLFLTCEDAVRGWWSALNIENSLELDLGLDLDFQLPELQISVFASHLICSTLL
jgi:hypothetical protein